MSIAQLSLKGRALKLLASREYSRVELERKLAEHEPDSSRIGALLDELTTRGYLSDERAADALVHRRAGKLGIARLAHELRSRGVDSAVTADALERLRLTELDRAREVWRKKFGHAPLDANERGRQVRFMAARGFGAEIIHRVVAGSDDD